MALGHKQACKGCKAPIFFGVNVKTGRPVPLEPGEKVFRIWTAVADDRRRDADELRVELVTVRGFIGHHFTCPHADDFRRGG